MRPVSSSNIAAVGWEPGPVPWVGTMEVAFIRGALYRYTGVPAIIADMVCVGAIAGSVGHTFHVLVRQDTYTYVRVQ